MPCSEVLHSGADISKETNPLLGHAPVPLLSSDTKSLGPQSVRHSSLSTALLESEKIAPECPSEPRTSETQYRLDRNDHWTAGSTKDTAPCGEVDAHNVVGFQNEIRSRYRSPSISVSPDSLFADAPVSPGIHTFITAHPRLRLNLLSQQTLASS
ncbi:hypothetical protein FGB62_35g05 [Gracilaria domingensis]|nr:hypothetical protein FGB62_35g05 [Gracilaria domingensis]